MADEKNSITDFLLYFFAVFTAGAHNAFAQVGIDSQREFPLVNSIEVKGLKRIEEGAVKSRITHKTGEPMASEKTANDIKKYLQDGLL